MRCLNKTIKNDFIPLFEKNNINSKLSDLTNKSYEVIEILEYELELDEIFQKNQFIYIFAKHN
jgi:hypothetical protein